MKSRFGTLLTGVALIAIVIYQSHFACLAQSAPASAITTIQASAECELPAGFATLHGKGVIQDYSMIYGWDDVGTFVSWRVRMQAGEAEVLVVQAAEAVSAGHAYQVEIAGKTLPGTVKNTGNWNAFQPVSLGMVTLEKDGEIEVVLRPLKKGARGLMNLQGILLRGPAADKAVLAQPEPQPVTVKPFVEPQYPDKPVLGNFFTKWTYTPKPFPSFSTLKNQLPAPIFEENPTWTAMYWKVWEIACRPGHWHMPKPGSGFVSPFVDAAFDTWDHKPRVYQWDTCFMTMFYNMSWPLTPGIDSLDNFYAHQFPDGEIPCQFWQNGLMTDRSTNVGRDILGSYGGGFPGPHSQWKPVVYRGREKPAQVPYVSLDWLNHPIFAWAEMEHYRMTGNKTRIGLVYTPLTRYYESLKTYIRQGNGLYMTDWASMDNSPRLPYLEAPNMGGISGCGVDISCEMVLFGRNLATMATMLGKNADAAKFANEADATAAIVNKLMWDPEKKFYFDLTSEDKRAPVKTIAGFWSLIAGVPSKDQAAALVAELENPKSFNRKHRVPTCSAEEKGFDPLGGYWRGAVWAPTETMVIRGLENAGHGELAREIAINHLENIGEVFKSTGTVWENYAADSANHGTPAQPDFVGWTGIGPVLYFLEFAIGLKPDAATNTLTWDIRSEKRSGCERYRFNGHVASLVARPDGEQCRVTVSADGPFVLKLWWHGKTTVVNVKPGENQWTL